MSSDGDFETGTLKEVKVRPQAARLLSNHLLKQLPPYAVILHNDDFNTFDFVIGVILKVFHYPVEKAIAHTLEAHQSGRTIVWSGSKEVAELKAEQILSCGADPEAKALGAQPLQVSIEAQ